MTIPDELEQAFKNHPDVKRIFDALPPSHQREYVQYIEEAKRPETRERRARKTIEALSVPKRA